MTSICNEIWKPVLGCEGFYEVSNMGRVRSVDHIMPAYVNALGKAIPERLFRGKVISQRKHKFGYWVVTLSINGESLTRTVHKLVCEAFLGKQPDGMVCRHKNGNPEDCRLENLEYGTQKENMADAIRHGTVCFGDSHYSHKLNGDEVLRMRELAKDGMKNTELAKLFGVSDVYVHKIVSGSRWGRYGDDFVRHRKCNILTPEQREEVRRLRADGMMYKDLKTKFGVSLTQLRNIISG